MKDAVTKDRKRYKKKFLYYFPKGYSDPKFYSWERGYKWEAHLAWEEDLNKKEYNKLLSGKEYTEISLRAVRLEPKNNLLFSFIFHWLQKIYFPGALAVFPAFRPAAFL